MRTMQTLFSKCLFLLLIMSRTEGIGIVRESDYSSVDQKTMKMILESCYKDDSSSKPILIFGDFNEFIDKPSVIRMNNLFKTEDPYRKPQVSNVGPGKMILIADSLEESSRDVKLLKNTRWWNPEIPLFIIHESNRICEIEGALKFLLMTWLYGSINSIYICAKSMNQSELWTANLMANYAPHPWQLRKRTRIPILKSTISIFSQVFYANVSCENLNYDKTKILTDYTVTGVAPMVTGLRRIRPRMSYCSSVSSINEFENKLLTSIFKALDVNRRCELETSSLDILERLLERTADMAFASNSIDMLPSQFSLFPHVTPELLAIVKLPPKMSTLQKIFKIWSPPVLILGGIALAILFIILTIANHDFSSAMLDVVRLLVFTSILTNNRRHSFRIFFTTLLILMIISNGVFRGLIAAFLTKQERIDAPETLDELMKSGYRLYTQPGMRPFVAEYYPKYYSEQVSLKDCIQYVLNSSNHVCLMNKFYYEKYFMSLPLDTVKQTWMRGFDNFKSRLDWPLKNRVDAMIMRTVQSGLVDHWYMEETYRQRFKRQAMEDDWSSAQYKPIKLYKLKFAFQLLALGLLLSTIVFLLELVV